MKFAVLLLALQSSVALAADMNICSPSDYNQQKDKAATEAGRERLLLDYCMSGSEVGPVDSGSRPQACSALRQMRELRRGHRPHNRE
jgi:hypothetical protein